MPDYNCTNAQLFFPSLVYRCVVYPIALLLNVELAYMPG